MRSLGDLKSRPEGAHLLEQNSVQSSLVAVWLCQVFQYDVKLMM